MQELPVRLLRRYFPVRPVKGKYMHFYVFCCIYARNDDLNKGMCQSVPHNDVVIEEKVTGAW